MESPKDSFRDYANADDHVIEFYKLNHQYQTVKFVEVQHKKFCTKFDICQMDIWDAIKRLDSIVDDSDPDLDIPQIHHAYQTAERLRLKYPDLDWLHLVGLIHDLGKVLTLPEFGSQEQWCVVGDTFPVGCKFSDKIVYPEFFNLNHNIINPFYNTELGIYEEKCGIDNLIMSFGHDEYMYQVLVHNGCLIPDIGLKIIRYHSFNAWHRDGAYQYFETDDDLETKKWCQTFCQCDLYTKDNTNILEIKTLEPYYKSLIDKYFPKQILSW